jgi:anti-anti-sigma factor
MPGIQITQNNTQAALILQENLVASLVPDLKSTLKNLLQQGVTKLEIDFTHVQIVDSTGIGCLIAAHNSLSKNGGSLSVFGMSQDIYELFCSMRLDRHFTIKPLV